MQVSVNFAFEFIVINAVKNGLEVGFHHQLLGFGQIQTTAHKIKELFFVHLANTHSMVTVHIIFMGQHDGHTAVVDMVRQHHNFLVLTAYGTFGTFEEIQGAAEGLFRTAEQRSAHLHISIRALALLTDDIVEVNPARAVDIGLGFSQSHTPVMAGRAGSVRFRDFGSCRDPFAGAGAETDVKVPEQDGVYPRYKTMRVAGELCVVPRPLGEGFGQGICWRFIPLRTVRDTVGGEGAAEWMLLERRPGKPARRLAGCGRGAATRVAERVARLVGGSYLYCAGTDQFAYFPGETIRVGADWCGSVPSAEAEIRDAAGRVAWRGTLTNDVAVTCPAALRPGCAPCRVSVRLGSDEITHEFAVLPEGPDAPGDFITVKDGNFMLHGKPWYPVGVNFWPGYIAGMEHADFWGGWMCGEGYAPALVERDLAHFAAMGGTMISIQAPAVKHVRNLL